MKKLPIVDNLFSHAPSSSWYNLTDDFIWDRSFDLSTNDKIIITDLFKIDYYPNKKVYGWLLESPLVTPDQYNYAKNNYNKFEGIFTFDKDLLEISNKFISLPIGGCWIEEHNRKIHKKTKLVSMIYSNKTNLTGHNFRHEIVKNITNVDLYGSGVKYVEKKSESIIDYMFSITVENCKKDFYFTEKLIDCFMVGTIPIYWGCPSVMNYFNPDGIITFETIPDLQQILSVIDSNFYERKKNAIIDNFNLAKKYLVADNLIYNYLESEYT